MNALRFFWRDFKAGELNLLLAAVTLAVMIVTAISLFAERLEKALVAEASVFLAADLVLKSPDPVDPQWLQAAHELQQAQIVQFPSMVFAGEEMALASVKAVTAAYPLRGQLEVSRQAFGPGQKIAGRPAPGEAWLDSRLLGALNVHPGDTIWIGEKTFVIRRILAREPDSGSSYWSLGPRVMIALEDLDATGVVQAGSRVEYRYLFAGDADALERYRQQLLPRLEKRHRLLRLEEEQPGLSQSLSRARHFLLLAASLGILLAAITIAMSAHRYALRHLDMMALLKVWGLPLAEMKRVLYVPLLALSAIGIFLGWSLGAVLQYAFLAIMQEWLPAVLPAASWRPWGVGAMTGLLCVMLFALPVLWPLLAVTPLHILRRDTGGEVRMRGWFYLMGAVALYALMWFFSQSILLASLMYAGTLLLASLVAVLGGLLLAGLRRWGARAGHLWRLASANMLRNPRHSILQLTLFTLILMLLLTSILIRSSLVAEWRQQLPPGTPNHFLINIAPAEVEPLQQRLQGQRLSHAGLYPMVRGRLLTINGVEATSLFGEQIDELYRELNLTWSNTLPEDNRIVAGQWWPAADAIRADKEVSIESGLAKKLGIKVGDRLQFGIGSETLTVAVSSIRELAWDRMRPNFYFIFEPGSLDPFPATYITSFYLPSQHKAWLNVLLKEFPTLTVFAVDEMIRRIQTMVEQVTRAIELVLWLILASGMLVFIAALQASLDQRYQEAALLRTLGASRGLLLGSLALEFACLGALAGLLAGAGSESIAWLLQAQVFASTYHFHGWPLLAGPAAGVLMVTLTGLLSCLKVVRVPPLHLLKDRLI